MSSSTGPRASFLVGRKDLPVSWRGVVRGVADTPIWVSVWGAGAGTHVCVNLTCHTMLALGEPIVCVFVCLCVCVCVSVLLFRL